MPRDQPRFVSLPPLSPSLRCASLGISGRKLLSKVRSPVHGNDFFLVGLDEFLFHRLPRLSNGHGAPLAAKERKK
ncbi:hypothetical protein E2C01_091017 [Portunus trituberculatus]|uniref:Uncharacterized protein n=1 Tax=Portunus trituberculatus TaxID=210409 RepID=A0A5B7JCW5_PORTR|nr:hypothetical protein [Portunus trituberculatus]